MNKFKVGDEVVCIDDEGSELTNGKHYKIKSILCGAPWQTEYYMEGEPFSWMESRFELFSEWASHQVPVNTETELALTKLQVKMLQDWRKENIKKVERYDWLRSVGKEQQNVIAHYGYEEMDKIIDKLMELENPDE